MTVVGFDVTDAAATSSDAASYLARLNQERSSHGLRPLAARADLTSIASTWAAHMARSGVLAHNPQLTSEVSGWQAVGENVGEAPTLDALDAAFMASPEHRDNILDPGYDEVGVGAVRADGLIWIAVEFRDPVGGRAPDSAPAQAAAPAAPAAPAPTPARTPQVVRSPSELVSGSVGPRVERLQRTLDVEPDGVFGPLTRRAVQHFQRRHHLEVDGIVGPRTRAALGRVREAAHSFDRRWSRARWPRVLLPWA